MADCGDGTIRAHLMGCGEELLAFLQVADRKRWVGIVPRRRLVPPLVNRGRGATAELHPYTSYGGSCQEHVLPKPRDDLAHHEVIVAGVPHLPPKAS